MAKPVEGTVRDGRDGGWGTHLPWSIPVQSDWNRSAPCADHSTGYRIQESSFSVCSWPIQGLLDVRRGEGDVNLLEFGEYSDPREPQHDVSVSVREHGDGGRSENIGGGEICEKG